MSPGQADYFLGRAPNRARFASRDDYLRHAARGDLFPAGAARLCQAVQRISGWNHTAATGNWDGFPWLTFVVGSGALESPLGQQHTPEQFAVAVVRQIKAKRSLESLGEALKLPNDLELDRLEAETVIKWSSDFTRDLIAGRLSAPSPHAAPSRPLVSAPAALFVVLTTLLTRFYYQTRAEESNAFRRWQDEVARVTIAAEPESGAGSSINPLLAAARELISFLLRDDLLGRGQTSVRAAIEGLLNEVGQAISPIPGAEQPRLSAEQLRRMTEVAWYLLALDSQKAYPGWTDTLLNLMLRGGSGTPHGWTVQRLPGLVAELLEDITRESWQDVAPYEEQDDRDALFRAIATVLNAQAAAPHPKAAPAVVYVTSFDLEMEKALWEAGQDFTVALPVHVLGSTADDAGTPAEFCWLLGDVTPRAGGDRLELLREHTRWRAAGQADERQLQKKPTIVRLTGCPLYQLPSENSGEGKELLGRLESCGIVASGRRLAPAVTVDEYLALRQSETELLHLHFLGDKHAARVLPASLSCDSDISARFWLLLGVPLSDPAVRSRFIAQLARRAQGRERDSAGASDDGGAPDAVNGGPPAESEPQLQLIPRGSIDGLAVNVRMGEEQVALLTWLGMDVLVGRRCHSLADDIAHCALHISRTTRPPLEQQCRLEGEA